MFCGSCGTTVSEGAKYCEGCGAAIQPIVSSDASAAAPAPALADVRVERTSIAPWIILAVFAIVMVFLGYAMLQFKLAGKKVHGADVAVTPAQLTLKAGETHLIEATVVGVENTDVGWAVLEGATGGTVVPAGATAHDGHVFSAGKYTAPATPGTYHVIATSKADETRASSSTITVVR